jgi:hypothetical protein
MKRIISYFCLFFLAIGTVETTMASPTPASSQQDLAYVTAFQAYIYGFAPDGMMQRLSNEIINPATRKSGFNEYFHFTQLSTPEIAPFRAPNNDTLYSTAWIDLRKEPAILIMPDTNDRFYTAQIMDLYSNTIANVGKRLYSTEPGLFAIVGPGWKGQLPPNIKAVIRSDTIYACILLRILVDGPTDVSNVVDLQKQFKIASLSRFLKGETGTDPNTLKGLQPYRGNTPEERLQALNQILLMNPVIPGEQAVLDQFAHINIGPGKASERVSPDNATLVRANTDAKKLIQAAGLKLGDVVNGWRIIRQVIGTYGFDYLQRAAVWEGGPLANLPEESLYPSAVTDSQGKPLDGKGNRYVIYFKLDQIPPVNAFWSLTMYKMSDGMLVKNPINRYSIGNRTKGLKFGPDGSLTIYVQHNSPGKDKELNWLPAPDALFYMSLRLYGPQPEVIAGKWSPPPVERVSGMTTKEPGDSKS